MCECFAARRYKLSESFNMIGYLIFIYYYRNFIEICI